MTIHWDAIGALCLATILGGLVGLEREIGRHWAGLRTHMLVAMGSCLFVHLGLSEEQALPRVMEGLLAGIGFIGGGTILKLKDRMEVRGLTTASTIWLAAGVGAAVGVGLIVLAIFATILSLVILVVGWRLEAWMGNRSDEVGKPG